MSVTFKSPIAANLYPFFSRFTALLFLIALCASSLVRVEAQIDRRAVVQRHSVHNTRVDPESALTLGNGDFALTVDVTGLQGLERVYYDNGLPLETRNTWTWHSFPNTDGLTLQDAMGTVDFHGRSIEYPIKQRSPAAAYFRENPHPMPLGQFAFTYHGEPLRTEDISAIDQTLDLWTGKVTSRLLVQGQPLEVVTVADGKEVRFAVEAKSPLIESGVLEVRIRFPYSYRTSVAHKPPFIWEQPDRHTSELAEQTDNHVRIRRSADETEYLVDIAWETKSQLRREQDHDFRLGSTGGDTLRFSVAFSDERHPIEVAGFEEVKASSAKGWASYWSEGGMIDLGSAKDPRAAELERRVIQSLYLMRVNYAGSMPPAESGLQHLTWFGKHHSEVYFIHAAQFYQWGHVDLLEKGLSWYRSIMPRAIEYAKSKGFEGVRWPKMSGIDGRPSPGGINPYIIWNQPNPIYLSELVYRAKPTEETLETYGELVFESAKFLVSFAHKDLDTGIYHLGPPIKNVSESTGAEVVRNPTFETAYWYFGLSLAQEWRKRLGMDPDPLWEEVRQNLADLPRTKDGQLYLEIEGMGHIYEVGPEKKIPVSMLLALGYLPATPKIDVETARRTFKTVFDHNGIERWVSWQMGQGAMTAARLGEPQIAIDILTNKEGPARFMPSGYVRRPKDPEGAVAYLPANGAFLGAVALMAGGWEGAPELEAPGFPRDGNWDILVEGVLPMP
ncbi:hypothetical protein [Pelagicoccus albus]|uniref:Uncharacterized protein n=1 Tax=Pelagicoccus albus TaxID=415222 RepID=A0A7X1B6S9_9BACT|nr:hypothetical protein [Pelagicoccus albus]MBC2606700.1 hypothetical protein [Pelagicoccus albus]